MRSEQLYNGQTMAERRRKRTAIIDGTRLASARTPLEQGIAWALLALSFIGAVLAFNGNRPWPLSVAAVCLGIGLQLVVTALEWVYQPKRTGLTGWYLVPLLFGAGSTLIGLGQYILPYLERSLASVAALRAPLASSGIPAYTVTAWVVLLIVALIVEIAPEAILVD